MLPSAEKMLDKHAACFETGISALVHVRATSNLNNKSIIALGLLIDQNTADFCDRVDKGKSWLRRSLLSLTDSPTALTSEALGA